ncbi:FkbM family methyltransferase [Helicobacter suis]|uniref:FkbM family methyltransferase n=1 Tax=Helicobacter suis TaxID=104628 RepID=UPI001F07D23A|nr:FkbM family methyltransferase [Helicobacter suis]
MAQKGYLVLQYDGSIEKSPDLHKNIIFHKKFVGTKNDSKTISLEQILQDYNLDVNAHNILQMDIEGAEWDIFEKLDFVLLEKYFAQIIVEFHSIDPRNRFQSERYLAILEKFNKAFQSIHLHVNTVSSYYYTGNTFLGNLIEVSYARKDLLPKDFSLRSVCGDIEGLDYPNDPNGQYFNISIDFT